MIPALGAGGPGFDSRIGPFLSWNGTKTKRDQIIIVMEPSLIKRDNPIDVSESCTRNINSEIMRLERTLLQWDTSFEKLYLRDARVSFPFPCAPVGHTIQFLLTFMERVGSQ